MARATGFLALFRDRMLAASGLLLLACGSDAPLDVGNSRSEQKPASEADPSDEAASQNAGDAFDIANQAPGYQPYAYPAGPYGITQGATIANLEFHGWSQPAVAAYNLAAAETVRLSDFYDPNGEKGVELLLINSVAVWCGVCRTEYADLQTSTLYPDLHARGLSMLGLVFEDNDGEPARYVDMVNWGTAFEVQFPFAVDPGFKTGVYFDRAATPMNMLVDARTMKILVLVTGYSTTLYETASDILTQRGR
jgi:hypothetical protein